MVPKTFLDTNIWFSAIYGSETCKKILRSHAEQKISLISSQQVMKELLRNLGKKIRQALPVLEEILTTYPPEILADPAVVPEKIRRLVDKKDQRIFVAAMKANVKYFVTGNTKDFAIEKLEKLTGIKIFTPQEMVKALDL